MVNELQTMKDRVVKVEIAPESERVVTGKGGLALAQAAARKLRLYSQAYRVLPKRKDTTQGFSTVHYMMALIHGLLSGGQGFCATEAMREDAPLLKMLGVERAPSAETVEEITKYLASHADGIASLNALLRFVAGGGIEREDHRALRACHGFVPGWADGTLLEVTGKTFDSIKYKDGEKGQMCTAAFIGPWLVGLNFAGKGEGEGEETHGRRLLKEGIVDVARRQGLMPHLLLLLDSLYGDGPTLDEIEAIKEKPAYIIGLNKLKEANRIMKEIGEGEWRDTGAQPSRGWEASGVCCAWIECDGWSRKRLMVCSRFRRTGEMIWNYAAVTTNLTDKDERVAALMTKHRVCFEQAIWMLYGYKQGMENQWKDLLSGMGLHHPPCAKAAVNAVFYAVAGLAYNLSVAVRRLALDGEARHMQLWNLRRSLFDLPARVTQHAGLALARLLDARSRLVEQLAAGMARLARL